MRATISESLAGVLGPPFKPTRSVQRPQLPAGCRLQVLVPLHLTLSIGRPNIGPPLSIREKYPREREVGQFDQDGSHSVLRV